MVSECKLCAVCRGCSQKFYDSIINGEMKEKSLPYELENYFLMPPQMHYYQQSMRSAKEHFHLRDRFLCLKGFSSSTPTIHSIAFDSECTGGGLYINYKGIGIVIDPGLGFVNSMHKYGIFINNIDVVIVTHDHLDHNADAKVISALLYDLNNYNKRKSKIVKEVFELDKVKEHTITWIVDGCTGRNLKSNVSNIKLLSNFCKNKKQLIKNNKDIKLAAIHTKHISDNPETYGIKLFLNYDETLTIGYTSDTAYFQELTAFYEKSDILVFNVSDIYKKDVKGIKNKSSHLGYNGSLKLLQNTNPSIAIASEFCCTNGDFRIDFSNVLSEEVRNSNNTSIIPGEVGLNIFMPQKRIECSRCRKLTSIEHIIILAPKKEYGKIQYSCRHCAKNMLS